MINVTIGVDKAQLVFTRISANLKNLAPAFRELQTYMQRQVTLMFSRIRRGGHYRGVSWEWFAPQYTRADGTVVPAEGGIAKVSGDGVVLGRLRPSGTRITASSSLMQDTGRMRSALLSKQDFVGNRMYIMETPLAYAAMMNELRPFQYFQEPKDVNMLQRIINNHITRGLSGAQRS